MKVTREYLKKLILMEMENSEISNSDDIVEVKGEPILSINEDFLESFEKVNDQNLLNEAQRHITEIKNINSEIKRMKQLVDFRRPLLSDENFSNF